MVVAILVFLLNDLCVCVCVAIVSLYLDLNSNGERRITCIATRTIKLHAQVHYDLTRCLKGATLYYLILAEYGRCPKLSHCNERHFPQRSLG